MPWFQTMDSFQDFAVTVDEKHVNFHPHKKTMDRTAVIEDQRITSLRKLSSAHESGKAAEKTFGKPLISGNGTTGFKINDHFSTHLIQCHLDERTHKYDKHCRKNKKHHRNDDLHRSFISFLFRQSETLRPLGIALDTQ